MDQSPEPRPTRQRREEPRRSCSECFLLAIFVLVILGILYGMALGPIGPGIKYSGINARMQQARQLGRVLFSYATDNTADGNAYPDGKSSTEVFQLMLDQGYVTDPALFYVPMPGKVSPEPGQKKLRPENVSWDITGGVASDGPETVPLVFLTGYRVTYAAGSAAVPLIKPFPQYGHDRLHDYFPFSWFQPNRSGPPRIAVFYKGNNAMTLLVRDDVIPNFVPAGFDAKGKTYRQLTPDGVLPPVTGGD